MFGFGSSPEFGLGSGSHLPSVLAVPPFPSHPSLHYPLSTLSAPSPSCPGSPPPLPLLKPLSVPPLLPWVLPSPLCLLCLFCLLFGCFVIVLLLSLLLFLLLICCWFIVFCPKNKTLILQCFLALLSSGFWPKKGQEPPPKKKKNSLFIFPFFLSSFFPFLLSFIVSLPSLASK